jgi:hypothetical protein
MMAGQVRKGFAAPYRGIARACGSVIGEKPF